MLVVLTYDHPHRKTQDLLVRLAVTGDQGAIVVVATPWRHRKNFVPLIPHRNFPPLDTSLERFCARLGVRLHKVEDNAIASVLDGLLPEAVLIGGAGILPSEVVDRHRVINSHPGYLPHVRGLDALKWAIYEGHPIGVTTHLAAVEADAGPLIRRELVPLHAWDTFHSIALRQYELEVQMLAEAVYDLAQAPLILPGADYPIHRRMNHDLEAQLFERLRMILPRADAN